MPMKLRRLWIQLTADRRRFGMLCAVLAVAMLLWARLIVVSRMPRTALAEEKAQSAAATDSTVAPISPSASITPLRVALAQEPGRDPFVISPHYFPRTTSFTELAQTEDKSTSKPAEESAATAARLTAQLRAMTQRMRLDAAVNGSIAVIDGRTYRVGDVVTIAASSASPSHTSGSSAVSFRLTEVGHRTATLEYEGRTFEIQMPGP